MLAHAWAFESRATQESVVGNFKREHDLPLHVRSASELCGQLAETHRNSGIVFSLGGARCLTPYDHAAPLPVKDTFELPADAGWHVYRWAIDRTAASAVGVLTIRHFVGTPTTEPQAWGDFAGVLHELEDQADVVVDLQDAEGDDPRVGFAILAALGLDAPSFYRPAVAHDDDFAKIARHNRAVSRLERVRSRQEWFAFQTLDDIWRIAAEIGVPKHARTRPLHHVTFLIGPGCAIACQLVVKLARDQRNVAIVGPAITDTVAGDDHGVIRLPHSGIEVVFPTVSYGPYTIGPLGSPWGVSPMSRTDVIAQLHRDGDARAGAATWDTQPPIDCATLPATATGLATKRGGCFSDRGSVSVRLSASVAVAQRFFASCPSTTIGTTVGPLADGSLIMWIAAPADTLARIANAPFVRAVEWECPVHTTSPGLN
jgi:hypothetical protein